MKRAAILFLLLAGSIGLCAQQPVSVSVPIQSHSFEPLSALEGYPSGPCGVSGRTLPGWQFSPNSGVFQPNGSCGIAPPPDGKTVAYAGYGGTFSQTLTTTPASLQEYKPGYSIDGVYVLKFSVANYFPVYPGYYEAKVSFGTQELCDTSGWGARTFTQIAVVCPSPGYLVINHTLPESGPVQGTNNFVISFSTPVTGWTLLFDDVSLSFTPN
jgi:hypothetical protein